MTEEEAKQDVTEQEAVVPADAEQQSTEAPSEPSKPQEKSKDYNWRRMEQKMAELERKNQEYEQSLKAQNKEPDEFDSLQDDDLVTKAQAEKAAERKAEQIVQKKLEEREKAQLPTKTKQKYEDYEQVVTNENLEKLVREDPDLEFDIQHAKNPYDRAYKEIKKANFFREEQKNKANSERIAANSSKPVNSASLNTKNPLDQANAFASWSKDELYREMLSAARSSG